MKELPIEDEITHADWMEIQREINEEIVAQMRERFKQRKTLVEMDVW